MKRLPLILLLLLFCIGVYTSCKTAKNKNGAPKGDAEITDTYWRLSEIDGKPLMTPADAREVYIKLNEKKGKLEGFAGCNSIGGKHSEGRHGKILFEPITTMLACERMDTETYLLRALNKANRYVINEKNLLLYNDNLVLAVFEAKYPQKEVKISKKRKAKK